MSGAPSHGAKHTRVRSMMRRIGAVLLSASILAFGTVAAHPQLAAAAVPVAYQNNIAGFVFRQQGNGPCPTYPINLGSLGYTVNGYHSCPSNGNDNPWCADFAGWAWSKAGVNVGGLTYWAHSFKDYGISHHTWYNFVGFTPEVGDAVVFVDSNGVPQHVAIVYSQSGSSGSGGTVTSIGGNEANAVGVHTYPSKVGTYVSSIGWYIGGYAEPVL
jgi:hypothetical protein